MRLTLDTNVLVSAFVSRDGNPARIVDLVLAFPEIKLVLSESILQEFRDVMLRKEVRERFEYSSRGIDAFVQDLRHVSTIIMVKSRFMVVKEDPKDNVVMNTAVDGKVDFVVSGDSHLQKLTKFRNVRIVSPKQMLRIITDRFGEIITYSDELRKASA